LIPNIRRAARLARMNRDWKSSGLASPVFFTSRRRLLALWSCRSDAGAASGGAAKMRNQRLRGSGGIGRSSQTWVAENLSRGIRKGHPKFDLPPGCGPSRKFRQPRVVAQVPRTTSSQGVPTSPQVLPDGHVKSDGGPWWQLSGGKTPRRAQCASPRRPRRTVPGNALRHPGSTPRRSHGRGDFFGHFAERVVAFSGGTPGPPYWITSCVSTIATCLTARPANRFQGCCRFGRAPSPDVRLDVLFIFNRKLEASDQASQTLPPARVSVTMSSVFTIDRGCRGNVNADANVVSGRRMSEARERCRDRAARSSADGTVFASAPLRESTELEDSSYGNLDTRCRPRAEGVSAGRP
jgi:hypothetical protein